LGVLPEDPVAPVPARRESELRDRAAGVDRLHRFAAAPGAAGEGAARAAAGAVPVPGALDPRLLRPPAALRLAADRSLHRRPGPAPARRRALRPRAADALAAPRALRAARALDDPRRARRAVRPATPAAELGAAAGG